MNDIKRNVCRRVQFRLASLLVIVLTLLAAQVAMALDPDKDADHYLYRSWSLKEGLPQATVVSVHLGDDGYLWMGTQGGLSRYNGAQFKNFNSINAPALVNDVLETTFKASDGTIWLGSIGGLGSLKDGEFHWFDDPLVQDEQINTICEDTAHHIWIGTISGKILIWDGGSFELVELESSVGTYSVSDLACAQENAVWIGTSRGLFKYKGRHISRPSSDPALLSDKVGAIMVDSKDRVWIGSESGVGYLDDGVFVVPEPLKVLSSTIVHALFEDRDGNLWIGTRPEGAFVYRRNRLENIDMYMSHARLAFSFAEDNEGNIYVGTPLGLYQVSDPKVITYSPHDENMSNSALAVYEDSRTDLFVGTESGLVRYGSRGIDVFGGEGEQSLKTTEAMAESADGGLWVGTDGGGVYLLKDSVITPVAGDIPALSHARVRAIFEDKAGQLFVGTKEQGLFVLKDGKIVMHFNEENGLPSNRVSGFVSISEKEHLILTIRGIVSYVDGKIRVPFDAKELVKIDGLDLLVDSRGSVWIASLYNGLYLLRQGKLTNFRIETGLPENTILSVLEGDDGNLWFGCLAGIFKVPREHLIDFAEGRRSKIDPLVLGPEDGLMTPECNGGTQGSSFKRRNGALLFACVDGAVSIEEKNFRVSEVSPPVVIETVAVDGELIGAGAKVPDGSSRVEFKFAALSFTTPESVKFKYKLEGYDKDWLELSGQRSAVYTNLEDGNYRFRVIAANSDGLWNEEGASFAFSQVPPYYKTWWFFTLFGIVAFLVIGILSFVRIRFERKRMEKMSRLAWSRTRGILEEQVDVIRHLVSDASGVSANMEELMGRLGSSSDQVSAAVTETAATVEQLERTGKSAEEHVHRIVEAARKSEDTARRGRSAAERSVAVMSDIQNDSAQIADRSRKLLARVAEVDLIAAMVGAISDQSSVLSINAAVEASQAGEYGEGFGVVAENMQELANRSKEATLEIADILRSITGAVNEIAAIASVGHERLEGGVKTIKESDRTVRELTGELEENSRLAGEISAAIEQQTTGLQYISNATGGFASAVRDNREISKSVSNGASRLVSSIQKMIETVENWKTPDSYLGRVDSMEPSRLEEGEE